MGLKSKTYCHWEEGSSNKASCKGISKKLNDPQKKVYLEVPQDRRRSEWQKQRIPCHRQQSLNLHVAPSRNLDDGHLTLTPSSVAELTG